LALAVESGAYGQTEGRTIATRVEACFGCEGKQTEGFVCPRCHAIADGLGHMLSPVPVVGAPEVPAGREVLGGGEKHEETITGLRKENRHLRHAIKILLEKNEELKGGPVEVLPETQAALRPLDDDERARLAYLTEEQSRNKLANHAMGADKLYELLDLRERAGVS